MGHWRGSIQAPGACAAERIRGETAL